MLAYKTLVDEIRMQKKELRKCFKEQRLGEAMRTAIQIETLEFVRDWSEDQ